MRYAVLLGISTVGHDDGALHADSLAQGISTQHPTRLVRIIDTCDDRLVATYRNGQVQSHG